MEKKLQEFLEKSFAPYGNFPARKDVEQELLANLVEKFNDLKTQGKSDDEAYQATVDSFGDVSEIMAEVNHTKVQTLVPEPEGEKETSVGKVIKNAFKLAKRSGSKFAMTELKESDLSDTDLSGADFSMSSLKGTNFNDAKLVAAKFSGSDVRGSTFVGADLSAAVFTGSDTSGSSFKDATLVNTQFKASALKDATFEGANLSGTKFSHSDIGAVSFDGMTLVGTMFEGSGLKNTSFKNTELIDVTFHHCDVKHTDFDGATMDKVTYALLKGAKAKLDNVNIK